MLDGGVAIAAEVLGHQLGELVGVGVERLRHRAAVLSEEALELLLEAVGDLARALGEGVLGLRGRALQLAANRVHLGAGRLPVEHAGADLERVQDRLLGADLTLEPALDQLDERAVLDQQAVYIDAVLAQLDALLVKLECLSGFHGEKVEPITLRLTSDGTAAAQQSLQQEVDYGRAIRVSPDEPC